MRTPAGMPACCARSASSREAPGSFSEGFSTKVLPAAVATGHIHSGTIAGKLKGQMPATTCGHGAPLTMNVRKVTEPLPNNF